MEQHPGRIFSVIVAILASACAAPDRRSDDSIADMISAERGGALALGSEVNLTIPPGSLAESSVIGIARLDEAPVGEGDGFVPAGIFRSSDRPCSR
jgi:hypothetical protein